MSAPMTFDPGSPLVVGGIAAGTIGLLLLVQARLQARLLRQRIAQGIGTAAIDAATGLFSPAAAWQCVRAEANRASRLDRTLTLQIGAADTAETIDQCGRELTFVLPDGAMGIRLDPLRLCVVSCVDGDQPIGELVDGLTWTERTIAPSEHAPTDAIAFFSEAAHG